MKNICFLIGNIGLSGGTERVTSTVANVLSMKGYRVSILSLSEGHNSFFRLEPDVKLDMLFEKKVSMKKKFFSAVYKIRKYISENKIDTLIVVDSILCIFTVPALIGLKTKHICWEHFNFNVDLGVSFRRMGRKWAAKHCDYIVTLTKRDKELWEAGLENIKAKIIPIANPTPFENIENTPSLEYKTVLAMGRLTYQKGFDLLLEAWSQVCKSNTDWILKIVGSGEDEQSLKDQAKQLGIEPRVEFIPVTQSVEHYFRTSSIFCLSSRFEGFGMVMIEAQSFGLPIVAFNCDAGPSDIILENRNGILIKELDVRDMAFNLIKVMDLDDLSYCEMTKAASNDSKRYGVDNLLHSWLELIEF